MCLTLCVRCVIAGRWKILIFRNTESRWKRKPLEEICLPAGVKIPTGRKGDRKPPGMERMRRLRKNGKSPKLQKQRPGKGRRQQASGRRRRPGSLPAGSPENAEKTECGALQGEVSSGETGKDSGEEDVMDLQMEAEKHLDCLKQYFTIWDRDPMPEEMLEKAYQEAIDLAAALERMMDGRKGAENGEEYHAQ